MRTYLTLITVLFMAINLNACAKIPTQKNFATPAPHQLWNIENKDVDPKSYIFFDKNDLGGFYVGCNRFNFNWKISDENTSIFFDNVMSTRMACFDETNEQANVEKLLRVNRYKIDKNKMQLFEDEELLFDLVLHSKSDSFFEKK